VLDFSETQVQDNGLRYIANAVFKIKELQTLHLDFHGRFGNLFDLLNSPNSTGPRALSATLTELKYLQNLCLIFSGFTCKINDEIFQNMISPLKTNNKLNSLKLVLYENMLTDNGIKSLAEHVGDLVWLTSLDLSFYWGNGQIFDEGVAALSTAITNLMNLSSLTLTFNWTNNGLTDRSIESICSSIKNHPQMTALSLEITGPGIKGRTITTSGMRTLCSSVATMSRLQTLNLIFQRYSGLVTLDKALGNDFYKMMKELSELRTVSLDFTGCTVNKDFKNTINTSRTNDKKQFAFSFKDN
jgi:hypothetical protein